jgi:hypothetical protein
MNDDNDDNEEEYLTFNDMPPDMQDLIGNFVHTLVGQLELGTVQQCLTAVKDKDTTSINDRHIAYDELNISERLFVAYCRALIDLKSRTLQ